MFQHEVIVWRDPHPTGFSCLWMPSPPERLTITVSHFMASSSSLSFDGSLGEEAVPGLDDFEREKKMSLTCRQAHKPARILRIPRHTDMSRSILDLSNTSSA